MDISDLTTRQIANALIVYAAASPFGKDATKAALMTVAAESSFKRYANNGESTRPEVWAAYGSRANFRDVIRQSLAYPHDAEAGAAWTTADSVGLFQQRPMYDYGTIRELMDPAESTRIFVRGSHGGDGRTRYFLGAPKGLSLARKCQWTQGSEFPTGENYAPMETVADQLINHFGGFPADDTTDWIDMADQAALDKYRAEIRKDVWDILINPDIVNLYARGLLGAHAGQGGNVDQVLSKFTEFQQHTLAAAADTNVRLAGIAEQFARIEAKLDQLSQKDNNPA